MKYILSIVISFGPALGVFWMIDIRRKPTILEKIRNIFLVLSTSATCTALSTKYLGLAMIGRTTTTWGSEATTNATKLLLICLPLTLLLHTFIQIRDRTKVGFPARKEKDRGKNANP